MFTPKLADRNSTKRLTIALLAVAVFLPDSISIPVATPLMAGEESAAPAKAEVGAAGTPQRPAADAGLLGSPAFQPSPEHPIGWRGDGTGHYPAAEPPVHWGRVAKSVKELRFQVAKPKEGDTGSPMPLGVIPEWLVLGPVDLPPDAPPFDLSESDFTKYRDPLFPDAGALRPEEGEELAGQKWRRIAVNSHIVDWLAVFRRGISRTKPCKPAVVLAHAYVYSPSGGPVAVQVRTQGASQLFVNGKVVFLWHRGWNPFMRQNVELRKGWNSVLSKTMPGYQDYLNWYTRLAFYGASGSEYESHSIAWIAHIPTETRGTGMGGISAPIIVGDRIFVTAVLVQRLSARPNPKQTRGVQRQATLLWQR